MWKDFFSIFCVRREALDSSAKRADTKVYLVCPKRYWKALSMHLQVWNRIPIRLLGKKEPQTRLFLAADSPDILLIHFSKKWKSTHFSVTIYVLCNVCSLYVSERQLYSYFNVVSLQSFIRISQVVFKSTHLFEQLITSAMNRIFNGLFFKGNPYCIVVHWSGRPNDITRGLFAIMSGRTFLYGLLAMLLLLLLLTMMTRMIITI